MAARGGESHPVGAFDLLSPSLGELRLTSSSPCSSFLAEEKEPQSPQSPEEVLFSGETEAVFQNELFEDSNLQSEAGKPPTFAYPMDVTDPSGLGSQTAVSLGEAKAGAPTATTQPDRFAKNPAYSKFRIMLFEALETQPDYPIYLTGI